jgi:hypothetical protein
MDDADLELFPVISDGGMAAPHAPIQDPPALVGPAVADQSNRLRLALAPVACWRVEAARFEFDSSFVNPEIALELQHLARLRKRFPAHPLSVFAHADPVGDDEYNKGLSGRRARAIYALLTRRADIWEELYSSPMGNDRWGEPALQTIAQAIAAPPPPSEPLTDEEMAFAFFQDADRGPGCPIFAVRRGKDAPEDSSPAPTSSTTPPDARAEAAKHDPKQREELFLDYMDRLCGPDLKFAKEDFLGRGADAHGKADFQGCGEFNPVLIFSQAEQRQFAKNSNTEERNEENSANRRVLVFFFRKGTRIDLKLWPCPRAQETSGGCRKRFWSDGEKRRSNQAQRREYPKTRDTFACRFYDRLAHRSPCETAPLPVRIRLYDTEGKFIPNAPYRLTLDDQPALEGVASGKGILTLRRRSGLTEGVIEWGLPPAEGEAPHYLFRDRIFLEFPDDPEAAAQRKLQNLGYGGGAPSKENVTAFQSDYQEQFGLSVTGILDPQTQQAINQVHDGMADQLKEQRG